MAAIGWRARWPLPANILAAALFMLAGAGVRPAAAHRHHPELRPVSAGLADAAAGAAEALAAVRARASPLSRSSLALGRNQVALLLCYLLIAAADRRDRRREPAAALSARTAARARRHDACRHGAAGGSAAVDPAVRRTLQSPGRAAGRSAERFALSGQPGDPCGRQHLRHARQLLRTERRIAARRRPHRRLVQLSVRRLAAADPAAVVRRRRRRRMAAGTAAARRHARRSRCCSCSAATRRCSRLAFAYIPGIDMFRRPADASFVFSAALALLCGASARRLHRATACRAAALADRARWRSQHSPSLHRRSPSRRVRATAMHALVEVAKVIAIPLLAIAALALRENRDRARRSSRRR